MRLSAPKSDQILGFSLVELLIVISIIAIISVMVAIIVNPIDLLRRTRDSTRLYDLQNLNRTIGTVITSSNDIPFIYCAPPEGDPEVPYASCVDSSSGDPNNTKRIDGQGWVRIDFRNQNIANISTLPTDPVNIVPDGLFYKYCSDGYNYEITATLESTRYQSIMIQDGGNSPDKYEIGSNLQIPSCD